MLRLKLKGSPRRFFGVVHSALSEPKFWAKATAGQTTNTHNASTFTANRFIRSQSVLKNVRQSLRSLKAPAEDSRPARSVVPSAVRTPRSPAGSTVAAAVGARQRSLVPMAVLVAALVALTGVQAVRGDPTPLARFHHVTGQAPGGSAGPPLRAAAWIQRGERGGCGGKGG